MPRLIEFLNQPFGPDGNNYTVGESLLLLATGILMLAFVIGVACHA